MTIGSMTADQYNKKFTERQKQEFKAIADEAQRKAQVMGLKIKWGGDLNGDGIMNDEEYNPSIIILETEQIVPQAF